MSLSTASLRLSDLEAWNGLELHPPFQPDDGCFMVVGLKFVRLIYDKKIQKT